jgi:hypothetical protein
LDAFAMPFGERKSFLPILRRGRAEGAREPPGARRCGFATRAKREKLAGRPDAGVTSFLSDVTE